MKYTIEGIRKAVDLSEKNFLRKGGEGSVYVIDDTVYKVCEPGKMIPEGKFAELALLDHPNIIKPEKKILDSSGSAVGYTMRLVPNDAVPLARILTRTFRDREGVTTDKMATLVKQLVDGVRYIHKHPGYLIVDANELNFMVPADYSGIYFIDVNSYQTPSYPATAIMLSIQDLTVKRDARGFFQWHHGSDWYSIAIVTWYMFTAMHPYKGFHPTYPNMKTYWQDQMRDNVSIFHDGIEIAEDAVYHPFENYIPGGKDGPYMKWYRAVLHEGKRLPAPLDFLAPVVVVKTEPKIRKITGSNNFVIQEIRHLSDRVVGYYTNDIDEVFVTRSMIQTKLNGDHPRPAGRFRIGFTNSGNPYVCEIVDGRIQLTDLRWKKTIPNDMVAKDIMSSGGRVYLHHEESIFEIGFINMGEVLTALPTKVASAMPNATTMFPGCAVQEMFGQIHISIFPKSRMHYQLHLRELSGQRIIDAKYENGVLVVIVLDKDGQYDEYIYKVIDDRHELLLKNQNVAYTGINFTVNDGGACLMKANDGSLLVFSSKKFGHDVRSFDDPAIKADMRFCHRGMAMQFALADQMYSISMRK